MTIGFIRLKGNHASLLHPALGRRLYSSLFLVVNTGHPKANLSDFNDLDNWRFLFSGDLPEQED